MQPDDDQSSTLLRRLIVLGWVIFGADNIVIRKPGGLPIVKPTSGWGHLAAGFVQLCPQEVFVQVCVNIREVEARV